MRMIAEALDDGNVDDEEQKQIEEAELQVNFFIDRSSRRLPDHACLVVHFHFLLVLHPAVKNLCLCVSKQLSKIRADEQAKLEAQPSRRGSAQVTVYEVRNSVISHVHGVRIGIVVDKKTVAQTELARDLKQAVWDDVFVVDVLYTRNSSKLLPWGKTLCLDSKLWRVEIWKPWISAAPAIHTSRSRWVTMRTRRKLSTRT